MTSIDCEQNNQNVIIDENYIVRNQLKPKDVPNVSVAEYLSNFMIEWDRELTALVDVDTGIKLTFHEWYDQSRHFTSSLINCNVTKNDLVLFFGENSVEYAVSLMGVIWMGCAFSPVTPANGQFELMQQLKDSQGSVLILDKNKLPVLKSAVNNPEYSEIIVLLKLVIVLNCTDYDSLLDNFADISNRIITYKLMMAKSSSEEASNLKIPYWPITQEDSFTIIYTSGTTSLPKGAVHSNYSTLATLLDSSFLPTKQITYALWYPFGHVSGLFSLLANIASGSKSILFADSALEKLLEYVAKEQLRLLTVSPAHAIKMAINDYQTKYDLTCLKVMICGGAKVPTNHIELIKQKYRVAFMERYGATEFIVSVFYDKWLMENSQTGNLGQVLPGIEMKIVDLDLGKNLPAHKTGEICFRGRPRFVGYLRNEKATKDSIDSEGWYHSGDIGYYDDTGSLFFVDRIKELIKFRSWSISPNEIENFMLKHPAVDSVCVVGVKHIIDMNLLRAYVQVKDGHQVSQDELIKYVQDNMGFQKRLMGGVRFITKMPLTSIGKVDRKYFRSLVQNEILTEPVDDE